MNSVLREIMTLICGKDAQLGQAAARVIGHVGMADAEATAALAETLAGTAPGLHPLILESLSSRGGESAASTLVRFLGEPGKTGEFAARAVSSAGEKAPRLLARVLEKGSPAQFRAAVEVLIGLKVKGAQELLAKALFGIHDVDMAGFAAAAVRNHVDELDGHVREGLARKAVDVLERCKPGSGGSEAPAAGALKYLGCLKRPCHARMFVKFCRRGMPTRIRHAALGGLAALKPGAISGKELGRTLLPMLGEADMPNIVKPCLDVLWQNPLPSEFRPKLAGFLGSPYEPVRRYAVREMGRSGSAREVKDLLSCLDSGDRELSERASGELRRMESAVDPLLARMKAARDFDAARRFANILLSHKERLDGRRVRDLALRMLALLGKGDERGRAYLWLVRAADPRMAADRLIGAARQARRGRRFDVAERFLRMLMAGDDTSPLARYELAVTMLRRSKRSLLKSARENDDGLSEVARLISGHELDLSRMLAAERELDDGVRYYVGFHFAERVGTERAFGGEVLRGLAAGRGKFAKLARGKLTTEGLLEKGRGGT